MGLRTHPRRQGTPLKGFLHQHGAPRLRRLPTAPLYVDREPPSEAKAEASEAVERRGRSPPRRSSRPWESLDRHVELPTRARTVAWTSESGSRKDGRVSAGS